ncbi:hypothetical protein M3172_19545 [Mesobacillus subterraneus]|uniref:hypothetical protein n=1 Tax=Mesobacillus subterraneus TaxID=285983 RepID=UPI00203F5A72|nr:hypothetical protein [Mesobacillus subterraneus]MCM3575399.1 hypothetical protein [Mesobacillus subterraneus]
MVSNIGAPGFVLLFNIVFLIVSVIIMYLVILKAVREGINQSVVGQFFEKKYGVKANKNDLDNNE